MNNKSIRPDRRHVRRWNVMWPATLVCEGKEYPCTILDLSEFGARIEARGIAYGPSLVKLQSERFGSIDGRVQWARGTAAGLRFEYAPEAVFQVLKPIVPGLGRREKTARAPAPTPSFRAGFGRLPRARVVAVS
jgi:hypothetical protein